MTIRTHRATWVAGCLIAIIALCFALTNLASAEVLTSRSVQLSTSSAASTNVTYSFEFTPNAPAAAFVVDFCSNSPAVGDPCVAPAGMSVNSASIPTSGYARSSVDSNTFIVTADVTNSVEFTVDGITNPSAAGLVYARVVTYDSLTNAQSYSSENIGTGSVDGGTIAFSITDTIGVSGSVMESVTFCVSGVEIGTNCTGVEKPVLKLGEQVGDVVALTQSQVSKGTIYAQVSTNALGGVTVNLKSSALNCGGLMRSGSPNSCDIGPSLTGGVEAGKPKFGVKIGSAPDTGTGPSGILQAAAGSIYSGASTFMLNFVTGNTAGITSVFGDPFLDTNGAPANNKNVALTFGASVSNDTPAGLYSTDLSLIATGRF